MFLAETKWGVDKGACRIFRPRAACAQVGGGDFSKYKFHVCAGKNKSPAWRQSARTREHFSALDKFIKRGDLKRAALGGSLGSFAKTPQTHAQNYFMCAFISPCERVMHMRRDPAQLKCTFRPTVWLKISSEICKKESTKVGDCLVPTWCWILLWNKCFWFKFMNKIPAP